MTMSTTAPATSTVGVTLPAPGNLLTIGNVINAAKLSEKTIELSTCAQFGQFYWPHFPPFAFPMVWFGLTQKQERQHGFDAASNLGGRAFILQFKVSANVLKTGIYKGTRRFNCQHQQMQQLRTAFGLTPGSCFYFFPNIGTFSELVVVQGDLLSNSYMVDVAHLPAIIPATHRANGYHYAYLNAAVPEVTITSEPFKPKKVYRANNFLKREIDKSQADFPSSKALIRSVRDIDGTSGRIADLFFKNAALVVFPHW